MKRVLLILLMFSFLFFGVGDYYFSMQDSYNRYLEGEYFFRYKATTVPVMQTDSWFDSIENFETVSSVDFSDTMNLLLYADGMEVYACCPHDGVCTVIYGSQTVDDFPVYNLSFSGDDAELFNGTKQYTFEEYIEIVNNLTSDQLKSDLVSDKRMANYKQLPTFLLSMLGADVLVCVLLFLLRKHDSEFIKNLILVLAILYNLLIEIIAFFVF